jgi:hypothetical protein
MVFRMYPNLRQKFLSLGYVSVPDENSDSEDEVNSKTQPPPRLSTRRIIIVFATSFTIIFVITAALLTFCYSSSNASLHNTVLQELPHCGNSAETARSRNCTYDVMLGGWTPPECYSPKLEAEYLTTLPDLKWYYDEAHTRELPIEVLKLGELETVYPAAGWHDRHCLYTWRRLSEAVQSGGLIDYQGGSPEHTRHCTGLLLGTIPPKPVKSEKTKYNYCVVVGSIYTRPAAAEPTAVQTN